MGQKVHPIGMRVGVIRDWDAKWYAEKEYADYLHEDLAIRQLIQTKLADASVSLIETGKTPKRHTKPIKSDCIAIWYFTGFKLYFLTIRLKNILAILPPHSNHFYKHYEYQEQDPFYY